jgi:ATP-dependent Clp protease protease subunit
MKLGQDFQNFATKHMGISSMRLHNFRSSMTPYILEEREMNVTQIDVFSRLMGERIIFLGDPIYDQVANIVTAQVLFMESVSEEPIKIYINSPGGSVYAGLGIYDTMQIIKAPVHTICTGLAASMGAVLLAGGEAGKRYALPHSRVMIHQPLGGADGQASDIQIVANEIQKLKQELYTILANHTGKSIAEVEKDGDRDYWMTATEAKTYGMVDGVLTKRN